MALGLLQGPSEMLPVSSSGHLALVPEILGWPYARLEPGVRKAFEVALHAGTAAAMAIVLRHDLLRLARTLDARRLGLLAATAAPPAVAGLVLGEAIERRLGGIGQIAVAQACAGLVLAACDRRPGRRSHRRADGRDHLAIGLAQAAALVPGVSRGGAVLTAARLRGFRRPAAGGLAREAGLAAIAAAAARTAVRLRREPLPPELAAPFTAGTAAAFAATLASSPLLRITDLKGSYPAIAGYRAVLGAIALWRSRRRR